ncbi:hypothetical protein JS561_07900 [Salmonella enterica subsp. enterica serovar Infantis]|nr:hypothetical protein JS561_07900 [Salmonella enterica subsp. enterica serovar Infantis]
MNQKGISRESTEKRCENVKLTGVKWHVNRPFANMASRSFKLFRKG